MRMKMRMTISGIEIEVIKTVFILFFFYKKILSIQTQTKASK